MPNTKEKEPRRFDVGATVMAKWPKTALYFKGEIIDYNDIDYLIKFEDEDNSELTVRYRDVESPFLGRRSRSRSLGRTPTKANKLLGRPKSPSRKSPSRKSPSRKSPGRTSPKSSAGKSPVRTGRGRPPHKNVQKEEATSSSNDIRALTEEKDEKLTKSEPMQIKDTSLSLTNLSSEVTSSTRQSARILALEKAPTSSSSSTSSTPLTRKSLYSETTMNSTNSITVDTRSIVKSVEQKSKVLEFLKRSARCLWATAQALPLAIMVITLPLFISLLCSTRKCNIQVPDFPKKLSSYYDPKALSIAGGFFFSLMLLSYLPVGKSVATRSGAKLRCNGYVSLLAIVMGAGVLLKVQYSVVSIYLLFRHFLVAATVLGAVTALLVYVKSFYARRDNLNPQGTTGYYLVDFINGRELCPRIGRLDVKFFFYRCSVLLLILLNLLVVGKDLQAKAGQYSPTLLVSAGMQVFYGLDLLVFEDNFLSTFEYNNQGMGLVTCVGYLNMPFLISIYTRYILNHGEELPWYCLVGAVALFLFGYTMLRGSNSQKHAFRTNPADPALVHLESLPTSRGTRLLVSGWWGLVRHPNYLGDFIVQFSWVLLCGFRHAIPWLATLFSLGYLFFHIFEVEAACRKKYGLAWVSYTARVPYRLVPKVF